MEGGRMSIGITIGLTCRDDAAEQRFLELFTQAAAHVSRIDGLDEFVPAKVVGAERQYLVHMMWRDESAMQAWLDNPRYQEIRQQARDEFFLEFWSRRSAPLTDRKYWVGS